jgi:uncharacterized protein with HEPN domain
MRRERLYLLDILEAADSIREFLNGVEEASFLQDDLLRSAVRKDEGVHGGWEPKGASGPQVDG